MFWREEMSEEQKIEFIRSILSLGDGFNDYGDLWESIWWRTDPEYAPVTFFVNCNDVFYWACADCETITPDNLPLLIQSVKDVRSQLAPTDVNQFIEEYECGSLGAMLFCCRVRGMRPQHPQLEHIDQKFQHLFLACGPERNPKDGD